MKSIKARVKPFIGQNSGWFFTSTAKGEVVHIRGETKWYYLAVTVRFQDSLLQSKD